MKITKEHLESLNAREEHVELFVKTFPEGAEINKENVILAQKVGIDIAWFLGRGANSIVKPLLENGADIHVLGDYALRWASKQERLEIVQFLLENGANIHAWDDYLCSRRQILIETGTSKQHGE